MAKKPHVNRAPSFDSSSPVHAELEAQQRAQESTRADHWLVDSKPFQGVVFLLIGCSVIQMGLEVDHSEYRLLWTICEHGFTALFLVEAIVKLWYLRRKYLLDKWNILDLTLVMLSVIDVWVFSLLLEGMAVDLQMMSILRVLRLVRVVRVVRLAKRWRKCVLVLKGVLQALQSAAWVGIVLAGVLYVGGIIATTHFKGSSASLYPGYTTDMAEIDDTDLMQEFNPYVCFGSLAGSMLTLLNMALMVEWAEVVRPMMLREPWLVFFFVVFAFFVTFGIINVAIGMIVETVLENAKELEEDRRRKDVDSKLQILESLETLWTSLVHRTGEEKVPFQRLQESMEQDQRWFDLLDKSSLPRGYGGAEFFLMLDDDGSQDLTYQEFVCNFYRLIDSGDFQHACIMQKGINELKFMLRGNTSRLERIEALLTGHDGVGDHTVLRTVAVSKASSFASHPVCSARSTSQRFEVEISKDAVLSEVQRELNLADALGRLSQIIRTLQVDIPGPEALQPSCAAPGLASRRYELAVGAEGEQTHKFGVTNAPFSTASPAGGPIANPKMDEVQHVPLLQPGEFCPFSLDPGNQRAGDGGPQEGVVDSIASNMVAPAVSLGGQQHCSGRPADLCGDGDPRSSRLFL